jgi:hypothetical protein
MQEERRRKSGGNQGGSRMQIYAWRKECQFAKGLTVKSITEIADASDVTTISRRDFLVVSTLAGIACGSDGARAFGSDGARAFQASDTTGSNAPRNGPEAD